MWEGSDRDFSRNDPRTLWAVLYDEYGNYLTEFELPHFLDFPAAVKGDHMYFLLRKPGDIAGQITNQPLYLTDS